MTAALAGALLVVSASGCAERLTTGVAADEQPAAAAETEAHGSQESGEEMAGNELSGTAWVLSASTLSGKGSAQAEITAEFSDEQMSGQAPVNRYMAPYEVQGQSIEFGVVAATLMAGPQAQMDLETEFFELLATVDSFTLDEDVLVLSAEDEEVMEFEATEQHSEE